MIRVYPHSIAQLTLAHLRAMWAARERVAAALEAKWLLFLEAHDAALDVFMAEDDERDGAA